MTPTTEFPVSDDDIRRLRIKVLKTLSAAHHPPQAIGTIALNNKLTVDDVKALVDGYGWPEPKEMARHAFELEGKNPPPASRDAARNRAVPAAGSPQHPGDLVVSLLTQGDKSEKARTRRLAGKIRDLLNELRDLVLAERTEREAAAAAAAERNRLQQEVRNLEAELAAKRALLGKRTTKTSSRSAAGVDAKEVRAWAAAHSVSCPERGRIPRDVAEAYLLAHPSVGDA